MAEDDYVPRTKQFANGDIYTGTFSQSGFPDGEGKYIWLDGSTYKGSWKEGVRHGIGKYTWPGGATYQGEWRDGLMFGLATWQSADGLSRYQGTWVGGVKQGLGRQVYGSGDVYEGLWREGLPCGPGRYVYADGNEYDGEWRGGRMNGRGTLVWRSGERYDGEWKDGRMDGLGLFTSVDGSLYDGRWRRGRKHGVGIFRPSPSGGSTNPPNHHQLPQLPPPAAVATIDRGAGAGGGIRPGREGLLRPGGWGEGGGGGWSTRGGKEGGQVQQEFPRGGSEMTPVHPGEDFTWSDYAPMTFRRLHESFGIDASGYMLSLCSDHSLRHMPSPGKSGSVFFLSQDERFFLKTLSRPEMSLLVALLPAYHRHLDRHPHSLLSRFLGLHAVTTPGGRKYRFVVMSNIFRTPLHLHRKYDLKGSTLGRTAGRTQTDDPSIIFKDLDLDLKLRLWGERLEGGWRERLFAQLRSSNSSNIPPPQPPTARTSPAPITRSYHAPGGVEGGLEGPGGGGGGGPPLQQQQQQQLVLSNELCRIRDRLARLRPRLGEVAVGDLAELLAYGYSLSPRFPPATQPPQPPQPPLPAASGPSAAHDTSPHPAALPAAEVAGGDGGGLGGAVPTATTALKGRSCGALQPQQPQPQQQLGVSMNAIAVHPDGREEPVVLWFGLIDILQPYNTTKRLEHGLKSVLHSSHSISVTHPATYANRFQTFMRGVFE
uniref:1-phosphatidylinositol-4-phosphate 5-kinase n=1 Tax=Volvox carteri f. nagariensis TaxID=3068 RepID=D9CIW1_VOLCA|nr:PIP5K1f [Volvox carteri f. nagariensis]